MNNSKPYFKTLKNNGDGIFLAVFDINDNLTYLHDYSDKGYEMDIAQLKHDIDVLLADNFDTSYWEGNLMEEIEIDDEFIDGLYPLNIMREWKRPGYTVTEIDHDYDLHAFEIESADGSIQTIYPDSIEAMKSIIDDLDNGDSVDGWEDGNGNTIHIFNKSDFEEMIRDWKADNAEEMEGLKVIEVIEESGIFVAYAEDEKSSYALTNDNGNIKISYIGSK